MNYLLNSVSICVDDGSDDDDDTDVGDGGCNSCDLYNIPSSNLTIRPSYSTIILCHHIIIPLDSRPFSRHQLSFNDSRILAYYRTMVQVPDSYLYIDEWIDRLID